MMPTKNHGIGVVPPPTEVKTRFRHFRGYYGYKPAQKIVQIKLHCHFVPPNVKRIRKAFMQAEGGVQLSTQLGNLYMDYKYYKQGELNDSILK